MVCAIVALSKTAEYYGCKDVVRVHFECSICRNTAILRSCERSPYEMVKLADTVTNDWILKEAATHYIPRDTEMTEHGDMPNESDANNHEELFVLLDKKRVKFIQHIKDFELAIFQLQPSGNSEGENLGCPFFRQWFSLGDLAHELLPEYAEKIRQVAAAEAPYNITRAEMERDFGGVRGIEPWLVDEAWRGLFKAGAEFAEELVEDVTLLQNEMRIEGLSHRKAC